MPRGPPRKPKQSGHALWVGNLPAGTQVVDLKDYFSRDARNDIESVFLISKSNCAFVNYRTEQACNEAMTRFHDSRFQNTRLVCRLRRNSAASSSVGAATPSPDLSADQSIDQMSGDEANKGEGEATLESTKSPPIGPSGLRASLRETGRDRIFIVKSLTVEDLDLSVRNGIWATQSHNETALNQAFEVCGKSFTSGWLCIRTNFLGTTDRRQRLPDIFRQQVWRILWLRQDDFTNSRRSIERD